jgi:antibiotic biosynthesis monooxygenase (ABM) superfamily enzyme
MKTRGNAMAYIIQYALSIFLFLFSTFSAWYEGSELRDKTWEWNHSAIFSKWKHGAVTNASEISGLDHFIYAAKFKPLYPILMMISMLYILVLIATWLLRNHTNKLFIFFSILGLSLILASLLTHKSPTTGLELFTWLFLLIGMSSIIVSVILKLKLPRQEQEIY